MKTLVVVGHPDLKASHVNKAWLKAASELPHREVLVHNLSRAMQDDGFFDLRTEHKLLLMADRIILQYPLWWYMPPYLMKRWMDTVWSEGFGWGEGGDKMKHLRIDVAVSCGAPEAAFSGTSLLTYLSYIPGSIDFVQARRGQLFSLYDADNVGSGDPEALRRSCEEYQAFIMGEREGIQL